MEKQTQESNPNISYIWDNPAARLLSLIEEIRKIPGATKPEDGWRSILKTKNMPTMYRRFSILCSLPDAAVATLTKIAPEFTRDIWGHWHGQANNMFFTAGLGAAQWQVVINQLDNHALKDLKTTKLVIENRRTPGSIDMPPLADLVERIREMIKEINGDASIKIELKVYVIKLLDSLIERIEDAFLTGFSPLEDAVDATYGHAVRNKDFNDFADTTVGKRVRDAVQDLANFVTITQGIAPAVPILVASTTKWILGGP